MVAEKEKKDSLLEHSLSNDFKRITVTGSGVNSTPSGKIELVFFDEYWESIKTFEIKKQGERSEITPKLASGRENVIKRELKVSVILDPIEAGKMAMGLMRAFNDMAKNEYNSQAQLLEVLSMDIKKILSNIEKKQKV